MQNAPHCCRRPRCTQYMYSPTAMMRPLQVAPQSPSNLRPNRLQIYALRRVNHLYNSMQTLLSRLLQRTRFYVYTPHTHSSVSHSPACRIINPPHPSLPTPNNDTPCSSAAAAGPTLQDHVFGPRAGRASQASRLQHAA